LYSNGSGAAQNAKNIAAELSGVRDIQRAATEAAKGNYAGAAGNAAMGLLSFIPGVGLVGKGLAKTGAAAVKATTKVAPRVTSTVASRVAPVTAKVKPQLSVSNLATPVNKATQRLTTSVSKKLRTKADDMGPIRSQAGVAGKVKAAGVKTANIATSPFVLADLGQGICSGYQGATNQANATQDGRTNLGDRPLGAGAPGTGGGTPGTGGAGQGGGVGPETPETGGPGEATPPVLEIPDMGEEGTGEGGGIDVGGGYGEDMYGEDQIATGGGQEFLGGGGQMGLPGGVAKANLQYAADQAAQRAQNRINDAAIREAFAQGIMGVRGTAADIIGGRSAAIRGQGVTGQRRAYQTGQAAEAQRFQGESNALARTYGEAVNAAYEQAAEQMAERARTKSEAAAQIRRMG